MTDGIGGWAVTDAILGSSDDAAAAAALVGGALALWFLWLSFRAWRDAGRRQTDSDCGKSREDNR
jgi:hypothetical protein